MKVCSVCGLSFSQIQKNKVFGCPECFYTFEEEIKIAYNNLNISEKYSGSLPKRLKGYKSKTTNSVSLESRLMFCSLSFVISSLISIVKSLI